MEFGAAPSEARERSAALFAAAILALAAFHLIGTVFLDGFALDLGSLNFPTPRYALCAAFWTLFGGLSAGLLALALSRRFGSPRHFDRWTAEWNAIPDGRFLIWTSAAAFVIPFVLRLRLLHNAPLTDDESAYRFAAELLASGRLWVPSPPLKLFFDQNFIINDGRMYAVYFLGWPLLLVPGVWIGAPGIVNPLLSALTVLPLHRALQHFVGSSWARGGVLLFLSSPFIQIAAATELAHTACLTALTWSLWMYVRTTADGASWRDHAGFAFGFALAFCIRPQSTVPLGLPLIGWWVWDVLHLDAARRVRAVGAFAIPAAFLAALFLGSLWAQNGSPFLTGYARSAQYLVENNFRFTTFGPAQVSAVPGFDLQIGPAIARTALGLFRLNSDLFGWPSSFAFLALGLPVLSRRTRLLWAMLGSFLLLMSFQSDWGIDTFGPVHGFELALPIVGLTMAGARSLSEHLTWAQSATVTPPRWTWSAFAPFLLASLIVTAWLGFVPVRLEAIRRIADHVNVALTAPGRSGLHRAVVFAPYPFARPCGDSPGHFVVFRPVNDPDLRNDILWVNHLTIDDDRRLLAALGGSRTGFVMRWTDRCEVTLLPLAELKPGDVPPAAVRPPR